MNMIRGSAQYIDYEWMENFDWDVIYADRPDLKLYQYASKQQRFY